MMKGTTHICLLLLLSAGASQATPPPSGPATDIHATLISSNHQAVTVAFELSEARTREVVRDRRTFESYELPGEGITYDYGKPILPAVSRFIVVPPGAGLELVVRTDEPRPVRSVHPPVLCLDEGLIETGGADIPVRQLEGLYPPVPAEMSEPLVIRGVRLVKVTTYPVQYDPSSNSYIHHDQIETEIRFTGDQPINPAQVPVRRSRSPQFLKFIRALALNPGEVGRDDPDQSPKYIGHYLVVTHEHCLEYAAPFIEWRRRAGYKIDILSIDEDNNRDPELIKDAIQDRYDAYLDQGIDPFDEILLIGDYIQYNYGPEPQWILDSFEGNTIWTADDRHADYLFACLEGDDHHPDVGISRWPSGSQALMDLAVGRTLGYEAAPYMDETDWFTRGGVFSQHHGSAPQTDWHISLHTNVRWGEEVLEQLGFDDIAFFEDFEWDQQGERIGPWLRDRFNEGTNLMIGRAQNYYWRQSFEGVDENVVFPIYLSLSTQSQWCSKMMFRTAIEYELRGPVAATCAWGHVPVAPVSAVWMELVNGVLLRDLPLGWGRIFAVTAIEIYLPDINWRGQPLYRHIKTDIDCYGDPGLQPWMGVPRVVEAEFLEIITPTTRMVEVNVFDPEDEEDVEGARVTLYAQGDMPDPDDPEYADYDGMFMTTARTSVDGIARFVFDEDVELEPGQMFVTVTGRDILPCFGEMGIEEAMAAVELAGYTLNEVEGNDDEELNPGETFALELTAVNLAEEGVARNVTAVVSSPSPWVEVEENLINFGDIEPGAEAEGDTVVPIHLSPTCPDGESRPDTRPTLLIEFSSGEDTWWSAIELDPVAPNFEVREVVGGIVIGVEDRELDIDVENIGRMDGPEITARMEPLSWDVGVVQDESSYPGIEAGGHSGLEGDAFVVTGNAQAVPGSRTEMMLILSSEEGFVDTAWFELQVRESMENAPMGPDDYGYICYDDTDEDWDLAPEYDWIEISLRENDRDHNGIPIDFEGRSEHDIGEARLVPLGFTTQFYGVEYDTVTVATNGFIAPGSQPRITNFQNWPLDRGIGGGAGMIAPFWDNLRFTDGSGVYYYLDEEEHRLIIEWYRLRHAGDGETDLTFQVVLLDKDVWITWTGDPDILFQYRSIANVRGPVEGHNWDRNTPYASVGISSPDGTAGISYTWNNEYPINAAPLENRKAVLFSTSPRISGGSVLYGQVTDAETGEPLPGVLIRFQLGFAGQTDEEGNYWFANVLPGVPIRLTFSKPGYNDTTVTVTLEEDERRELNIAMLHPEFALDGLPLRATLPPGGITELPFSIRNDGNGMLQWTVEKRLPDNADADPWELRRSYPVCDNLQDNRLEGVIFAGDRFYLVGANYHGRNDDRDNTVYVLDRDGALVDTFPQFGESRWGMKDLAWDGELIWGGGANSIYGFTPEGELQVSFEGPHDVNRALAWDPDRKLLWIASTTDIVGVDSAGNVQEELDRCGLFIYGLAYWPEDPDGYQLYIFHDNQMERQVVHKMSPDTGDTLFVRELFPEGGGRPGGVFVTNQFDRYSWVFMVLANDGSQDRIDVWQLEPNTDWMRVEPTEGEVPPDTSQGLILTMDATDLDTGMYEGELVFNHNAEGGQTIAEVELLVTWVEIRDGDPMPLPGEFGIARVYPNPFNASIQIVYALPHPGEVNVAILDLTGRSVRTLLQGRHRAGRYRGLWDGRNYLGSAVPSGVYICRVVSGGEVSLRKMVMVK